MQPVTGCQNSIKTFSSHKTVLKQDAVPKLAITSKDSMLTFFH